MTPTREKWIIEVNNDDEMYEHIHNLWLTNDVIYEPSEIYTQTVNSIPEALELLEEDKHCLIIIYSGDRRYFEHLPMLIENRVTPLILVKRDNSEHREVFDLTEGNILYKALSRIPADQDPEHDIVVSAKGIIRMFLRAAYGIPYFPDGRPELEDLE